MLNDLVDDFSLHAENAQLRARLVFLEHKQSNHTMDARVCYYSHAMRTSHHLFDDQKSFWILCFSCMEGKGYASEEEFFKEVE